MGNSVFGNVRGMSKKKLIFSLNSIDFYGLKEYHMGASLVELLGYFDTDQYSLIQLWKTPLYEDTYHVKGDKGKVLFLFTNSYKNRHDLENLFLKVVNLLEDKIIVMPSRGELYQNFSIQEIALMGIWVLQMRVRGLSLKKKVFCANLLLAARRNLEKISKIIDKRKVRSVVTLADVHLIDCLVTSYCNKRGIKTVTLQHGFFPVGDSFYRYSESDYFLTYSEYTKQLASKFKKRRGLFLPVGLPECIGLNKITSRENHKRERFLVLLNCPLKDYHVDNKSMLIICKKYAEENNCFFDVLAHPSTSKTVLCEYQNIVSDRARFIKSGTNISDMFDKYQFCVANRTTMVLRAIYELTPIILYCSKGRAPFIDIKVTNLYFGNCYEMKECIVNITEPDYNDTLLKVRDYLCGSGDITYNYKEFLSRLL